MVRKREDTELDEIDRDLKKPTHLAVRYDLDAMLEDAWFSCLRDAVPKKHDNDVVRNLCSRVHRGILMAVALRADEVQEPISSTDLVNMMEDHLGFDAKTIRSRIKELLKYQLVVKQRCPHDKRFRRMVPSDSFRNCIDRYDELKILIMRHCLAKAGVETNKPEQDRIPDDVFTSVADALS